MSSEGAEGALNRVGAAADKMARQTEQAADKAGKAVDGIGTGATKSAEEFSRSEGKIVASIKRATTQLEQLGKTASQKLEMRISTQGIDATKFEPYLARLRELEAAQARVGVSGRGMGGQLQNTSYQLQDLIVQVNGGTDATKALAMQLPQMLVGFGAAGAAIGVVAALLPNLIGLFGDSAKESKKLSDAMSDFDKAIGNVGQTVKTFDMEKLYEQFNGSSAAVRAATLEQIKFQQEFIKTTQLVAGKKFGESLGGLGEYSTMDKFAGAYAGSGPEKLANQLGVSLETAKNLLPALAGLRSGTEDVNLVFSKFGTTLLGGNAKAVELASTMADLAKSDRDAAAASSTLSEAQAKMAKGHVTTKKELEEAAKASKAAKKEMSELDALLNGINGKDSGFDSNYVKNVETMLAAYGKGKLTLGEFNDVFGRYVAMQPGAVAAEKERAKAADEYYKALSSSDDALVKQAEKLEQEVELYGMSESAIQSVIVARLEEARAIAAANGAYPEHLAYLDREIDARKRIAAAAGSKDALDANKRAVEQSARALEKFYDDINRGLTDSIFRSLEAGEDRADVFFDSLKRTAATTVLKFGIEFAMDAGKQALGLALNAIFGGAAGSGGGLGSALGLVSNASSAYGLLSGQTLSNAANVIGTGYGALTGTGAVGGQAFAAGLASPEASEAAMWAYQSAFQTTGEAAYLATAEGIAAGQQAVSGFMSSLGTAALVAAPLIIGGLVDKYGGGDTFQTGVTLDGKYGKGGFAGAIGENYKTTSGWFNNGREETYLTDLNLSVRDMIGMLTSNADREISNIGGKDYLTYKSQLSDAQYAELLGQIGIQVGEKAGKVERMGTYLDAERGFVTEARLVDAIVPAFKTAAEMTDAEIRANWSNLVDVNNYRYLSRETGNEYLPGYELPVYAGVSQEGDFNQYAEQKRILNGAFGGNVRHQPSRLVSKDLGTYDAIGEALDDIYTKTVTSFEKLGKDLGATDINAILDGYAADIKIDNVGGIKDLLNGAATQLQEGIGRSIFPVIDAIRATTGETGTWSETFVRVSAQAAQVAQAFEMLDVSLSSTGLANDILSTGNALVTAFGGIEGLQTTLASYYDNFYTAEEKRANTIKAIGDQLRAAGAEVTDSQLGTATREQFREAYESIVETTGAASPLAIEILKVSSAFASIAPAADAAASATKSLTSALDADLNGLKNSVQAEKDAAQKRYDAQVAGLELQTEAAQSYASYMQNIASSIKSSLDAVSDYRRYTSASESGQYSDAFAQYAAQQGDIYTYLDSLSGQADAQVTAAEAAAKQIEDAITDLGKALTSELSSLDVIVTGAQGQINAINKVDTSVLSVEAAIAKLDSTIAASLAKPAAQAPYEPVSGAATTAADAVSGVAASGQTAAMQDAISSALAGNSAYQVLLNGIASTSETIAAAMRAINPSITASQVAGYGDKQAWIDLYKGLEASGDSKAANLLASLTPQVEDLLGQKSSAASLAAEIAKLVADYWVIPGETTASATTSPKSESQAPAPLPAYVAQAAPVIEKTAAQIAGLASQVAGTFGGLQQQLWQMQGNTEAMRDVQRIGLQSIIDDLGAFNADAALIAAAQRNLAAQTQIWSIEDAKRGADNAMSAMQRAIGAQKDSIKTAADAQIAALKGSVDGQQAAIRTAQDSMGTLERIFDTVSDGVKRLRNVADPAQTMLQARSYIDMSLMLARSGAMPDQEKLSDAIGVITADQSTMYESLAEFGFAQLVQAGKLDEIGSIAGLQKTVAEQQLDALRSMSDAAEDQIKAIEKASQGEIAALDSMYESYRNQIDALNGIDTSVLSVRDAVSALDAAISGLAGALGSQTMPQYQAALAGSKPKAPTTAGSVYTSDAGVLSLTKAQEAAKTSASVAYSLLASVAGADVANSVSTVDALYELVRDYNVIPGFAVGTPYVQQDMLANIHKGEIIIDPASSNILRKYGIGIQGGGSDPAMLAEIKALRETNAKLEARLEGIEKNTREIRDLTWRVTEGGSNMKTVSL